MTYELKGKRVLVLGSGGMVGSAVMRRLVTVEGIGDVCGVRSSHVADLRHYDSAFLRIEEFTPDVVIMAAGRVGGIGRNIAEPVEMLRENALMAVNVLQAAHVWGVERLLYLGSSCMYPRDAPQPMRECDLMSGPLEPTNAGYALAKLVGVQLVESYRKQYGRDWISAIPCNLYGPGDNYDPKDSHVVAALIRKVAEARRDERQTITIWGSGRPMRELMHVDDLADACVFLLQHYHGPGPINVGSGDEISISNLVNTLWSISHGPSAGAVLWDTTKPDGVLRKVMDSSRIRSMGWAPQINLEDGIERVYRDFEKTLAQPDR